MVAKITFPIRVEAALNYNEQKVQKGKAVCLGASGYLKEAGDMNFHQKLARLERNNGLNQKATTKTLHVSLNFDPSERLSNDKLTAIAEHYMERLGFGDQPYLVYRHEDAGHPHIHIVSTTIREDGSRINTHNLGKNASEPARKEIEQQFGLRKAERGTKKTPNIPRPIVMEKAVYGKGETKSAIAGIVSYVFLQYQFSSLPQYNAALRQFGVVADRGKEDGRIYRNGGLVYRLLDEQGAKAGVPIKASSLPCRATLQALEKKFAENETLQTEAVERLKKVLEKVLPIVSNMSQLSAQLAAQNIYLLPRKSADGRMYGITFVDNATKYVFNGSDLGKQYSAAAIQSRMTAGEGISTRREEGTEKRPVSPTSAAAKELSVHEKMGGLQKEIQKMTDLLVSPKEGFETTPQGLLQKKRKKKKRRDPNSSH